MKALVYTDTAELTYRDAPMPEVPEGYDLIRIEASGICGSDMHAFLGHDERRPTPLVLGHEAAGTVVGGDNDGRRVTINPLNACGTCEVCQQGRENLCAERKIISMPPREGAFAEYVAIPRENLVTVPDHVSFAQASLCEPLACGWHGVRLADECLGKPMGDARCLVIGGGAIGVGGALSLAAFGAKDITILEPNPMRQKTLEALGIAQVAGAEGAPDPGQMDVVIDAVGYSATRATACAQARPGGVIVHIGLGEAEGGLDVRRLTLQEIRLICTYTYTPQDFRETAAAIFDGRLGALDWTEERPLEQGQSAFDDIRAGRVASPKIILIPAHKE